MVRSAPRLLLGSLLARLPYQDARGGAPPMIEPHGTRDSESRGGAVDARVQASQSSRRRSTETDQAYHWSATAAIAGKPAVARFCVTPTALTGSGMISDPELPGACEKLRTGESAMECQPLRCSRWAP